MSKVFRARYMAEIRKEAPELLDQATAKQLMRHPWVVYAKRPFAGPRAVMEYIGRYTHKIAISDHRIRSIEEDKVTFSYKDYRQGGAKKTIALHPVEFIRRFSLHILPRGFTRIRHYGILSSSRMKKDIEQIRQQLGELGAVMIDTQPRKKTATPYIPEQCPKCKQMSMRTVHEFDERGPPQVWVERLAAQRKRPPAQRA